MAHPEKSQFTIKTAKPAAASMLLRRALRYGAPLVGLLSLHAGAQQVSEEPQPLTWTCRIVSAPRSALLCTASSQAASVQQTDVRSDVTAPGYTADLFATGQGANITRLTRSKPELYAGGSWAVPLFAPIIDEALGRQLAIAVMCGREPLCDVDLAPAPAVLERTALPEKRFSWPWARAQH